MGFGIKNRRSRLMASMLASGRKAKRRSMNRSRSILSKSMGRNVPRIVTELEPTNYAFLSSIFQISISNKLKSFHFLHKLVLTWAHHQSLHLHSAVPFPLPSVQDNKVRNQIIENTFNQIIHLLNQICPPYLNCPRSR